MSPLLTAAAGLRPERAGYVLTLLGVCAIAGVSLGGYANDRFGARRAQAMALPVLAATFASLTVAALAATPHGVAAILPLIALWGLSAWSFFPPQQAHLVGLAGPAHTPVALSLNASFMYLGFSCGAALGYVVIAQTSVAWIGLAGAFCILGAMPVSAFAWRTKADGQPISIDLQPIG